jgi:cytochrome c peroxidase
VRVPRSLTSMALLLFAIVCNAQPMVQEERIPPLPVEVVRALSHSPIPKPSVDRSNAVQQQPEAIQLGARLFADPRLSAGKGLACTSCHQQSQGWSDGRQVATNGESTGLRRTPSIRNAVYQRWFGWDGSADSLWSQAIRPIENPFEMGADRLAVSRFVSSSPDIEPQFTALFGSSATDRCKAANDEKIELRIRREAATDCIRNVGKVLAAFVATIVSSPNRFDSFVARVRGGETVERAGLAGQELSGLRVFFGKGSCFTCHTGPLFSNGEFHNLALYPTVKGGWTDSGRLGGIRNVLASEFNQLRSDLSPEELERAPTRYLTTRENAWGQFKTPSLRNASSQAYFMHHGQFGSLRQVVAFYSDMRGMDATDHHRELSIMPLQLSPIEQDDLVRFLELIGE